MKFIYFLVSAVFLFNPLISNIDILPDAVAYVMLLLAVSPLSYLEGDFAEVYKRGKTMLIISAVKLLSLAFISPTDVTMYLVLSFTFCVIELIFGVPFINSLFDSCGTLAVENGNERCYKTSDKIKRITVICFAARLILAFLPDLTALTIDGSYDDNFTSLVSFRPMLFVFSIFFSLIFGVVWLFFYIGFFKKLCTKGLISNVNDRFSLKKEEKEYIFSSKDNIRTLIVAIIASIAVIDINVGDLNIVPDVIFPCVVMLSFLYLVMRGKMKIGADFCALSILLCAYIAMSTVEHLAAKDYFAVYNLDSVNRSSEAEDKYLLLSIYALITAVLFVATLVFIMRIIAKNGREYVRKYSSKYSSDVDFQLQEFNRRMRNNMICTGIFGAVSAAVYALTVFQKPFAIFLILINSIAEIIFIIFFVRLCLYPYDEVYKRSIELI